MACISTRARKAVVDIALLVPDLDVSGFDEAQLDEAVAQARTAQRCLDGYILRLGSRANRLAAVGEAAPADETLRGKGTVGSRQARREAKRSETAEGLQGLGDAASVGATSGEHLDSVGRHLTKLSDEQRSMIDVDELVEKAKTLPPETFDRYIKRMVEGLMQDHGLADANAKREASEFRHWFDQRIGMGRFAGALDPERYEALTNAIDQYMATLAAGADHEVTLGPNLAASALVDLVLASGSNARRQPASVTVLVDHDTIVHGAHPESIRQTEQGHDLAPETIARLCCDATIRRVTLDETGVPINVGRKYRTATDAQWAATKAMYASCAWSGCAAPIGWCQLHHIREWENGGSTDIDNLVPLCSRHHHRVHEGQWYIKLLPDRTLVIQKPDGAQHATVRNIKRE